jgi:hypothetical protein
VLLLLLLLLLVVVVVVVKDAMGISSTLLLPALATSIGAASKELGAAAAAPVDP